MRAGGRDLNPPSYPVARPHNPGSQDRARAKEMGRTEALSKVMIRDHEDLDTVFQKFRETSPTDRPGRDALFSAFAKGLRHHIEVEESDLFPELRERSPHQKGLVEMLYDDHRRIEGTLRNLEARLASTSPNTEDLDFELLNLLGEHNVREESFAYPWLDDHLSTQRQIEVGRSFDQDATTDRAD